VSKRSVHVERLEIRLRGVSAEEARAAAGRLGGALLEELSRGPGAADTARGAQGGAGRRDELHRVVARKVAASVRGRLK
jgi:hypothetical protein